MSAFTAIAGVKTIRISAVLTGKKTATKTATKLSILLAGLLLAVSNMSLQAASFDCSHARLSSEKSICNTRSLNDRDVKMATTFNILTHVLPMGGRDHLKDQQASWLKQRNACGSKVACLSTAYQQRQQQLDLLLQQRVYSQGPF